MKIKKILIFILLTIMIFTVTAMPVSASNTLLDTAQEKNAYTIEESVKNNSIALRSQFDSCSKKYRIIDVEKYARENNIPLELDGKKISKIEVELKEIVSEDFNNQEIEQNFVAPRTAWVLSGWKDQGSGWFNRSDDLYADVTTSGPDTLTISKTDTFNSTISGNAGFSIKALEVGLGFSINKGYSITISTSTPVARGQKINVKAYITHLKKTNRIVSSGGAGAGSNGTVTAYKPNGVYFQKTWY